MPINHENINKIVINSIEKPVDYESFKRFIIKSPFIRQIAFIGKAILEMPEFPEMVRFCAANNIYLIFGEVGPTSLENIRAMVEYGNVIIVNIHENDPNIDKLLEFKEQFNSDIPEVNIIIKTEPRTPQDSLSETSYAFYNLADDLNNIGCLNLLNEPMLDYDGSLLGCWQKPDKKHPINAFDLGIEKALNHRAYKRILNMLKTGKIDLSCPCARCPVFLSLIWSDKTIDICSKIPKEYR